jgi:hypothetical protein
MKRTIVLLAVLLGVIAIGVILGTRQKDSSKSFEDYEGDFSIEQIDDIARIVIQNGRKYMVDLTKTSSGWMVDGKYKARMASVTPLLDAIHGLEVKYIPPKAAEEFIRWDIAANGIQVDAYSNDGDLVKSYFIAGANKDESGTHALMNGATQPFVVYLPTTSGSVRARFELQPHDWRDRHFLGIKSDDIKSVEVEYHRQKSQSFKITRDGEGFTVDALHPELKSGDVSYRQGSAETYLYSVSNLACESFKNDYVGIDSIRNLTPVSTLKVDLINGSEPFEIDVYPAGKPVQSEFTGPLHRLFLDVQPGDFVGAQYHVIKGILKGYDFFRNGPEQEIMYW